MWEELKIFPRYFVTKTKCTCIKKTQCLPVLVCLVFSIDQVYNKWMIVHKAYKFKLRINHPDTAAKLYQFAGCARFVWNKVLALNLSRLERKQRLMWYTETAFWLTVWKSSDDYEFLKNCHSQILQQSLKQLEKAFKDGFDKNQPLKRMPGFKRRGAKDSFRYPQGFKVVGSRVFLPKIGWLRMRKSRDIEGTAKNVTVSRQSNGWYVSIQTEIEMPEPVHQSSTMVGGDLGVKRFLTLSDGTVFEPLNSFRKMENKLARAQRNLSRKVKFSNNWKKQQAKIGRIHSRIANARHDTLHKISSEISKNHAMIVLEDLKVRNMSKSAKGDTENHGRMVKQKSGLNKSILDQGWSMFRQFLDYKQAWAGGQTLYVDPKYTSQRCPVCHHVSKDNRQTQAKFECAECGYSNNADLVGAINVLAAGHAVLACGEIGLPSSMKQEPQAAATHQVGWN